MCTDRWLTAPAIPLAKQREAFRFCVASFDAVTVTLLQRQACEAHVFAVVISDRMAIRLLVRRSRQAEVFAIGVFDRIAGRAGGDGRWRQ